MPRLRDIIRDGFLSVFDSRDRGNRRKREMALFLVPALALAEQEAP
jgi:hypothetical protein